MKKLVIGFSKPKAWYARPLSWLIQKIEKADYSHVYIRLSNSNLKNDFYYHASGRKVIFMGSDIFESSNIKVREHEFIISDLAYYKILDFAISEVGKPYSISQLVGIATTRLLRIFGIKIKNPFGRKGYVCTELVATMFMSIYKIKFNKDMNLVNLNDIMNVVQRFEKSKDNTKIKIMNIVEEFKKPN